MTLDPDRRWSNEPRYHLVRGSRGHHAADEGRLLRNSSVYRELRRRSGDLELDAVPAPGSVHLRQGHALRRTTTVAGWSPSPRLT